MSDSDSDDDESSNDDSTADEATPEKKKKKKDKKNSKGKKPLKKSGRDLTVETCSGHPIPWPHFYVFNTDVMRGAHYDDLTLGEWVYGFLKQTEDPKWKSQKGYMLKYIGEFMDDVKDRPNDWEYLRNMHGKILTMMEGGSLEWKNKRAIRRLRTRHVYNIAHLKDKHTTSYAGNTADLNLVPCAAYQK
ncbi:MAG: hypothetical protein GY774_37185, partial [Planctomycetes bacterium]|nr:hypothetical protein [Planctomycetota bacterium]